MERFSNYKYETDADLVVRLRMDAATFAAAGAEPAGDVDLGIRGLVSGNRTREFGVHPRGVRLAMEVGTAPFTYNRYKFLPVLTKAAFATATYAEGADITIGTETWTVLDQVSEKLN